MKRSVIAVFSISIIMFCLVFLMWMNVKGVDMPLAKEEISKEILMNTEYKELKIGEDTMVYPSFLNIKSETDDCIELESDDKTVSMIFRRYIPDGSIDTEYKKEINKLDNITYKDNDKGSSYAVSGYKDGENIYYNRYITSNEYISGVDMIYPEEFKEEFNPIVETVVDSINMNKKYGRDGSSNASTSSNDGDLYAGTVIDNSEGPVEFPGINILGKYKEGREYDGSGYGFIVGKNLQNSKAIDDPVEYNKFSNFWGSMEYPDYLKPYIVPTNGKGISFKTEGYDGMEMSFYVERNNILDDQPYSPDTEYDKLLNDERYDNIDNLTEREKNGSYLYYSYTGISRGGFGAEEIEGTTRVYKVINYYDSEYQVSIFMDINPEYYNKNKKKIDEIYERAKDTITIYDFEM